MLSFESREDPLLSRSAFARRLAGNALAAVALIFVSLLIGMAGYHWFEGMSWMDAYVNAAMILSGMGPMGPLSTEAGKAFAGTYALYSGLALVLTTGLILAPMLHRVMHRFHLQADDDDAREGPIA
jgi:hypothetical protein